MIIPDRVIVELASKAGFGANLRNTHLVKLVLFAKYIVEYVNAQTHSE
jgi:hypothetical protein